MFIRAGAYRHIEMTWRRIKLYLFGVVLGLLLTLVLFKGRSFDACSPEGRVTTQIAGMKKLQIDSNLLRKMDSMKLPVDSLRTGIARGHVDFSRSQAQKEPCREYLIEFDHSGKQLDAYFQLCMADSTAKLLYLQSR